MYRILCDTFHGRYPLLSVQYHPKIQMYMHKKILLQYFTFLYMNIFLKNIGNHLNIYNFLLFFTITYMGEK